ncbi:cytochrome c oxidase subunit 7B2, mitochondrial [Castor canadensis]|jgi:cytochrome c oxidase subunit 7b|uniref:Cytochrome c oxidase subunit 7B, mitochondrial n=2 Tax=Castor canadensis TaxID=51338 RepID=A0A8C0XPE4_CASCN|nr:cytochrome c oxidase subunit 7B2, mitochondrial-like [Castor canadensis]
MMFHLARYTQSILKIRSIQQVMARQNHDKRLPDFHDKYGIAVLAGGTAFCAVAWVILSTQMGIEWNLSPVGRVTPKEWKEN